MKKMKKRFLWFIGVIAMVLMVHGTAMALTTAGTPIIAIDGDGDGNTSVDVMSVALTSGYTYGYFLDGGATFNPLSSVSTTTFAGGSVIDFALYDGTTYYTLSGDSADNTYSVEIGFENEVTIGSPQEPAGWTDPYYYSANITWTIVDVLNTNELALNDTNNNDGVAPQAVPEPSTLLLLGSGLLGLAYFGRRKYRG